jgi:type IV pilus assembly protein PilP
MISLTPVIGLGLVLMITGCGASSVEELHVWMVEQSKQTRPKLVVLDKSRPFEPLSYTQTTPMDPFNALKLTHASSNKSLALREIQGSLMGAQSSHQTAHLKDFPLEAMTMVGSLTQAGQTVGLVKVENNLYQVRVGNPLGQNLGRVSNVSESAITVRERVQDAPGKLGKWTERMATLALQARLN